MLKGLGFKEGQTKLDEEQIDLIIEAHTETVDALKQERDQFKADAESLPTVTKERDKLQRDIDDLKAKTPDAAEVQAKFDEYKAQVEADKAAEKKRAAVKAALLKEGANDGLVDLMLKGIDLETVDMDGDVLKDETAVVTPVKELYPQAFGKTTTEGAPPVNPPPGGAKTGKDAFEAMTLSQRFAFAKEHPKEAAEYTQKKG
jgi:myosin heavy subunit